MFITVLMAGFHFVAFGLGIGALMQRKKMLKALKLHFDASILARLLKAEKLWIITFSLMWITGLYRLFSGAEKPAAFYLQTPYFHLKISLVFVLLLIEGFLAVKLFSWGRKMRAGETGLPGSTKSASVIHAITFHVYLILPFIATAMARGLRF